jgi:hypothetical protein
MNDFQIGEQNYKLTVNDCGKIGYNTSDNCWNDWNYQPAIYYPYFTHTHVVDDKISKAFKVVSKLIENKIVKEMTIGEFIKLVTEIAEIL